MPKSESPPIHIGWPQKPSPFGCDWAGLCGAAVHAARGTEQAEDPDGLTAVGDGTHGDTRVPRAGAGRGRGRRPGLVRIEQGSAGLMVGRWVSRARELPAGKPEAWRREWPELHQAELEEVRKARREWADRPGSLAVAPDLAPMPGAAG